jgi:hypothetical protein
MDNRHFLNTIIFTTTFSLIGTFDALFTLKFVLLIGRIVDAIKALPGIGRVRRVLIALLPLLHLKHCVPRLTGASQG